MDEKQKEVILNDNTENETLVEAVGDEVTEAENDVMENEAADESEVAEASQEDAVDYRAEVERLRAEVEAARGEAKRERDKAANIKGKAAHLSKVVKRGLDDGLLLPDELGFEGIDSKEVQVWVEKGVDKDAVDRKLQFFDTQVNSNLDWYKDQYGDVNDLIGNYALALKEDPQERERLDRTPDAVVVDYILRRGKEVAEEVQDVKQAGSALKVVKQLKARIAELEASQQGASESSPKAKPSVKTAPSVVVKTSTGGGSFYENI